MVRSYISDGPYRDFNLDNITISFKHRTNRDISNMSTMTILVIEALKCPGARKYVDDQTISTLRNVLSNQDKETVLRGNLQIVQTGYSELYERSARHEEDCIVAR